MNEYVKVEVKKNSDKLRSNFNLLFQDVIKVDNKFSKEQQKFYEEIYDILWKEWDPIGISCTDCPRDEYNEYLPRVYNIAVSTNDPQRIAEYLEYVTIEIMGLGSNMEHALTIAKRVLYQRSVCGL